ncbi:MAG: hypothetical protein ACI4OH_05040 [Mitsuokella sp.]|uniref:hypothetical protein n=1 Tax=Mitsuokella sp. TaxID=2049034 RepID=UPI003F062B4F
MDLYQLNIFPGGDLEKALQSGKIPACADIAGQADLYIAARDFLMGEGIERLSLCHWRRHKREHSRYNTMAKTGAVVYPFGCGAGGNFGGLTFMQQRRLQAYSQAVRAGRKPIMMMAHQVERKLQQTSDTVIANLETGFLDFRQLCLADSRLEELEIVLDLWKKRGLMQEDLGICRLTKTGEFWYISLTQSLVECMQVICQPEETASAPTEEGQSEDALDACLAEMMPGSTFEERSAMVRKIPLPVRMMLKRSSKDALKNMLAGLPPAMLKRMLNKASD